MNQPDAVTKEECTQSAPRKARREKSVRYEFCAALTGTIAVGGLFLGFFFRGSPLGTALAGGEPILRGSLLGVLIEVFRGSIPIPSATIGSLADASAFALFVLIPVLAAAVALSLAFAVAALAKPSSAKKLFFFGAYTVFFAYGALFCATFLHGAASGRTLSEALDLPTLLACAALLALLAIAAAMREGLSALLSLLLFVPSAISCLTLAYPGQRFLADLNAAMFHKGNAALEFALYAIFPIAAANLVLSAVRLNAGGKHFFDILRFGLQVVASVFLLAAYYSENAGSSLLAMLPAAALLLSSSFAAFFLAALKAAIFKKKTGRRSAKRTAPASSPSPAQQA